MLADASDAMLPTIGCTEGYRQRGFGYFSVQGTLRNIKECRIETSLTVFTEILGYDAIRLHTYQYIVDDSVDVTLATGEHLMLHVDTRSRKTTSAPMDILERLDFAFESHRPLIQPKGMGAVIKSCKE